MTNGTILYSECHIDTLLAKIISEKYNFTNNVWHVRGTELFGRMEQNKNAHIASGFFDKNKNLHQVAEFQKYEEISSNNFISLLRHNDLPHKHLFYVTMGVEEWILGAASAAEIPLKDYNLPDDLDTFAKISKSENLSDNRDMRRFLKALVKAQPPHIQTLEEYISTTFRLEKRW